MPKSSTQFLRNIDYAPSNPQVLAQHIQAQNSKSLPALIALNSQNDQAATANRHGLLQQGQQPTIAEREITEAMPQVAGIPAGGMPNAGGISPMAANGVGALGGPLPQPIGSGVGQLPAPPIDPRVMAAGGGLISLANGGQVIPFQNEGVVPHYEREDYVPFSERSGLQQLGGFFAGDDSDLIGVGLPEFLGGEGLIQGDIGVGVRDFASDPTNWLAAIPVGGLGLRYGAKGLRLALNRAKELGLDEKAMRQIRSFYRNPDKKIPNLTKAQQKQIDQMFPKLGKEVPKDVRAPATKLWKNPQTGKMERIKTGAGDYSLGRMAITGAGLSYGGKGIRSLMGDDAAPEGQRELMGPPKPSAALMEQNRRANELQKQLKAAQDAAAKAGKGGEATPATKKGGLASLFGGLSPSAAQAMIVGGLKYAETGKAGEAAKEGITTGLAVKSQDLAQKKLKADEDYREKSLKLEEDKMNLVFKAAVKNAGITHNELLKAEISFNDKRMDGFIKEARAELEVIEKDVIDLAKKKAKKAFRTDVIDTFDMSSRTGMLGDVNDVLGARGVQ